MKIKPMAIVLGLVGQAIIALASFCLIPDSCLPGNVRFLDFTVTSVVYWLWGSNLCIAPADMGDASGRNESALGISWKVICWYSALAIVFMAVNIFLAGGNSGALGFKVQLAVQFALLLLFLAAAYMLSSSAGSAKGKRVRVQRLKSGKDDLKKAIDSLVEIALADNNLPDDLRRRIETLALDTRYVNPSDTKEALVLDKSIISDCAILRPELSDFEMHHDDIYKNMAHLERHLKRRRRLV